MSYALDESHTSRNFTPNANVQATFGYPRDIKWITIHHWGNNGQQFGIVRDYLCTNTTPTSAHFVVEDGQVACIVNPVDAAWHAGNAQGNAQSIGIECRPEHTDGDYQTVGELVAFLRSQYGDLPLVPHNHWTSTACPGDYDLARIDAIARGGTVTAQAGTITPITPAAPEDDMFTDTDRAQVKAIFDAIFTGGDSTPYKVSLLALVDDIPRRVSQMPVTRTGPDGHPVTVPWIQDTANGATDSARAAVGVVNVPAAVWNQSVGSGNAAGVLNHIDQKPAATAAVASVDVDALATKLAATLPAAVVAQLATQLAKL